MFLIVNVQTQLTYRHPGHVGSAQYETERGAKIAATKLNRKFSTVVWMAMSAEDYELAHPVKMKKVKNLMSDKEIEIPENTPLCCDPSSETYWSM